MMTKYKLVIVADVAVPDGVKFAAKKAAKEIKRDYVQYLPEDCGQYLPVDTKISKVGVTLDAE